MGAKHTPGPWAVHGYPGYVVPEAHLSRPIGGAVDDDYDLRHYAQEICSFVAKDRHRSHFETQANARLIAAGPDLLKIVIRLRESLTNGERNRDTMLSIDHDDLRALVVEARAAIAKATGSHHDQ